MAQTDVAAVLRHLRCWAGTSDLAALTDRQLLQRFTSQRDETAFAVLVQRHGPLVLGVCRRVLGRIPDAEDAFQATFLVLLRRAATVAWRESIGSWLYEVARHVALKARDAAARRPTELQPADLAAA